MDADRAKALFYKIFISCQTESQLMWFLLKNSISPVFCGDLPQASVRGTKFYWMTHEGTLADNMLGLKTFCQNNNFCLEIVAMTSRLSKYLI